MVDATAAGTPCDRDVIIRGNDTATFAATVTATLETVLPATSMGTVTSTMSIAVAHRRAKTPHHPHTRPPIVNGDGDVSAADVSAAGHWAP
jgi:hypothetical protein